MLTACSKDDTDNGGEEIPAAPAALIVSPETLSVPQEGGTYTLTVTSPTRPSVTSNTDWVTVADGTFKDYSISYTVSVSANPLYEHREALLSLSAGTLTASVSVIQSAAQRPEDDPSLADETDAELTNVNASAQARKVYAYLRSQYGTKMLSGVQSGGTANNNENLEAIYQLTGRHPAVSDYDFIFLPYSPTPAGWSWKVDYGDISAARDHWAHHGLVSYMWHWNVPTSQAAWEKGKTGDFDGYAFYCNKTAFDIRRALVAGNWENDFLLQDIEKVAGYLKLLQAEGIPVLWRPLHEAAGNYNIYGGNGAWFWWGRGGAEACKALWKLLRDKLEGEYGLDNLIWVWTLDATPGAESQYADWYPGNDLVDIVGVDIYEDNTEAKSRQFKAAQALSGGHKMTTVSECGNIPDPQKCFADGESWSWFLVWSLDASEYTYNTDSYWKTLMSSSRVVTRESIPSLQ